MKASTVPEGEVDTGGTEDTPRDVEGRSGDRGSGAP